jgi:hypothetical protein
MAAVRRAAPDRRNRRRAAVGRGCMRKRGEGVWRGMAQRSIPRRPLDPTTQARLANGQTCARAPRSSATASPIPTTSPYFASMSKSAASCGPDARSATASRGTTTR